jgi:hypothetical protein
MGVGESSLLVTFLAIPCFSTRPTANIGPLVELRFLELDVKDHSGLTLLL